MGGSKKVLAVAVLLASVLGILGSYGVAWFGIRINTVANSRAAFSALKGNPLATLLIPLKSGMSVGLLLVAIELFFMICILAFLDRDLAGPCFIGFAIGESLGASALRICGEGDEGLRDTARALLARGPAGRRRDQLSTHLGQRAGGERRDCLDLQAALADGFT